jgi:gluconolactonase
VGPDGKVYVCNNGGFEWYDLNGIVAPGPRRADYIGGRIQRVDNRHR